MPFASTTIRNRRRSEVRRRDGDGPCALQVTTDCQAVDGWIDYDARPPHPRSFTVDHIVSTEEATMLGWPPEVIDALENCQIACRQCNREKSSGLQAAAVASRPTYINPRFT